MGSEVQGLNIFQLGGKVTNTGIQLRGLPKRYSNVYIDGVKMNDPSASDNGFYSQGLFKDSIDRIEILRDGAYPEYNTIPPEIPSNFWGKRPPR